MRRLFWSIATLVVFVLLTVAIWYWWADVKKLIVFIGDQEAFGAYLQSFGIWGPLVLWGAQLLQVFVAFIPGHVVLIAAGYVYGFVLGLIFNVTFTVAASQLAYLFARWAGRPFGLPPRRSRNRRLLGAHRRGACSSSPSLSCCRSSLQMR